MSLFEKVSRLKVRFVSSKGLLTVDDLWDLPLSGGAKLSSLDDIAKDLFKQLKTDEEVSFVFKDKKSDPLVQLKFDIVKHIIEVRLAEDEARASERSNAAKRKHLLRLIAEREDDELKGKSPEELRAMLGELE